MADMTLMRPILLLMYMTITTLASADEGGSDTLCQPYVGMREEQFMKQFIACACFRPSLKSGGEDDLRRTPEPQLGARMTYVCMQRPDEYSTVTIFHDKIESIATESAYRRN